MLSDILRYGPGAALRLLCLRMPGYYLIYDNECPLCCQSTEVVRRMDRLGLVKLMPLSLVRESVELSTIPLPLDGEMQKAIHLIASDGRVWAGSEAVGRLAALCPRSRLLGRFILLPGVRVLARWVYGFVARHRMRRPGGAGVATK